MSKFCGTVVGSARTEATRRGFDGIRVSAQSYDGSLITRMRYDGQGNLKVQLDMNDGSSSCSGRTVFWGTFDELRQKLEAKEPEHTAKDYETFFMNTYDEVVCLVNQYENGEIDADMLANAIRHTKYRMDHFVDGVMAQQSLSEARR